MSYQKIVRKGLAYTPPRTKPFHLYSSENQTSLLILLREPNLFTYTPPRTKPLYLYSSENQTISLILLRESNLFTYTPPRTKPLYLYFSQNQTSLLILLREPTKLLYAYLVSSSEDCFKLIPDRPSNRHKREGSESRAPCIHELNIGWRRVVSHGLRSLYSWKRAPGTNWIGGWVGPRIGFDAFHERNTSISCPCRE